MASLRHKHMHRETAPAQVFKPVRYFFFHNMRFFQGKWLWCFYDYSETGGQIFSRHSCSSSGDDFLTGYCLRYLLVPSLRLCAEETLWYYGDDCSIKMIDANEEWFSLLFAPLHKPLCSLCLVNGSAFNLSKFHQMSRSGTKSGVFLFVFLVGCIMPVSSNTAEVNRLSTWFHEITQLLQWNKYHDICTFRTSLHTYTNKHIRLCLPPLCIAVLCKGTLFMSRNYYTMVNWVKRETRMRSNVSTITFSVQMPKYTLLSYWNTKLWSCIAATNFL